MARTKLNDEHWHKLFIILRQINIYNKPNLRRTVEGMLYRIRVGCPWRDLPSYFGHWSSIYQSLIAPLINKISIKDTPKTPEDTGKCNNSTNIAAQYQTAAIIAHCIRT